MMRPQHVLIAAVILVFANPWAALAQGGCPSSNIADVLKDPRVQEELADAWSDSREGHPDEHEEGAWIYQCRAINVLTGDYRYFTDVRRWPPGTVDGIHPPYPPRTDDQCRLVADFHTHPGGGPRVNPETDDFDNWEPSDDDRAASAESGVPGIIRYGYDGRTTDMPYGYNGMEEPRDPSWTCPGDDANDGWGVGEPHVKTLDGLAYDFQAIGTFTYLASERNDFEIQVQQQAYQALRYASFNSALTVRDGADRIEWSIDRPDPLLNGVARPMVPGSAVKLRSRGVLRRTPEGYQFRSSAGDRLTVVASTEMVDFYLRPARHRRGKVRGLLGNFDGNRDNDFNTADGKPVAVTGEVVDFNHPLYAQFGASWRVSGPGLITRTLPAGANPLAFPERAPDTVNQAMAAAQVKCESAGVTNPEAREACAFDLAATGNEAFVRSAVRAGREELARERAVGIPLAIGTAVTGALNGREARTVYTITLTPGTYLLDSTGSERTSWTMEAPDGTTLVSAEQGRLMGKAPTPVTVTVGGGHRITVVVQWEMLDGSYRIRMDRH